MNANRIPLLAANWKQNQLWEDCEQFVSELKDMCPGYFNQDEDPAVDIVLCPPSVYVSLVGNLLDTAHVYLGAQNTGQFPPGAYTGESSAEMLSDIGCDFCIVGHSERRALFGETDEIVTAKLEQLLANDIVPILCVGESLEMRKEGRAESLVLRQLDAVRDVVAKFDPGEIVFAYEPIWAIGTGENAEPEDAQKMTFCIRDWLLRNISEDSAQASLLLYGGSVKPANILDYMAMEDVDGALIGGASLQAASFGEMVNKCKQARLG